MKNAPRPIDNPVPIGQALSDVTLVDDLSATNSDKPIQPLRDAIEAALAQRPGIREAKVSRELVAVREVVERELPEVALVPVATFGMWCRECGVPDDQADAIRDILHYMGSLFYFGRDRLDRERDRDLAPGQRRLHERRPDTVLSKFIINPVWLKHAAYKVFEESERSEWLDRHKLQAKVVAADARCKGHKRGGDVIEAFLELVELSFYDEEKQQYLLPRGLKIGRPPGFDHWPAARLYWDFVPESAFHRFVVRMHHGKQVEKMGGGYAHGRDWVMVLYRQCRLVVSADTVNGVVEIRFNPESISNDWPEAFTIIRHEFAQYLICKPPMRVEGIEQSGESEEHRALRALVEQAKESDWVNVGVASSRTGMAEPTLKDATYPKHGRSRNPGQYLRLDDTCGIVGGRTKVGYVWRKVGKKYQFLSSSLSDWGHRGC